MFALKRQNTLSLKLNIISSLKSRTERDPLEHRLRTTQAEARASSSRLIHGRAENKQTILYIL